MTAADDAHKAALHEVAGVSGAGETQLRLTGDQFAALTEIPDEVAGINGLTLLDLSETNVVSLAPLAALTG